MPSQGGAGGLRGRGGRKRATILRRNQNSLSSDSIWSKKWQGSRSYSKRSGNDASGIGGSRLNQTTDWDFLNAFLNFLLRKAEFS